MVERLKPSLSIIVPCFNERQTIDACLASIAEQDPQGFKGFSQVAVIVVDGGSEDGTVEQVKSSIRQYDDASTLSFSVLSSPNKGRAAQMNFGAQHAHSDVFLFLHSDSVLPSGALLDLSTSLQAGDEPSSYWGFFGVDFNNPNRRYRLLSFMIGLRSSLFSIATGDQAIFVEAYLFWRVQGFPNQVLMEDIELSKRLKAIGRPQVLAKKIVSSARKWENEGFLRTVLLMWELRFRYWRGASADEIYARYYR